MPVSSWKESGEDGEKNGACTRPFNTGTGSGKTENSCPISIICVFNNRDILSKALLSWLSCQTMLFELVLLDNTQKQYPSAAVALNEGADRAKGEILVFTHQDVVAGSPDFLAGLLAFIKALPGAAVTGVAGKRDNRVMFSNALHGEPPVPAGNRQISEPTEVQTLDECLLAVPADLFRRLRFDPIACPDWHLYGTDLCYTAKMAEIPVIVLPLSLHHLSPGRSLSLGYYTTLWRLLGKYGENVPGILTSLGWYPAGMTGRLRVAAYILLYTLRKVPFFLIGKVSRRA